MEKKYKRIPFDVNRINEEGIKVVTRDGRIARIVCIDALGNKPIVALVTTEGGSFEIPYDYVKNGRQFNNGQSDADLFLKVPIKYRRMTKQELAWWLRECPEEHREWRWNCDTWGNTVNTVFIYYDGDDAISEVDRNIRIRRNGGEWEEPLIEIEEE